MSVPPIDMETTQGWYRSLPKSTKFLVISGAGISVSAGLPTFVSSSAEIDGRSSSSLLSSGPRATSSSLQLEDIFNWNTVVERQSQPQRDNFMHYTAQMRQKVLQVQKPTVFHSWVQQSHRRITLWLSFNIDGLETALCSEEESRKLGPKVVRGHGSLNQLRCNACQETISYGREEIKYILQHKTLPHEQCRAQNKRHANRQCWYRPTVTLYGTDPENQYHHAAVTKQLNHVLQRHDRSTTIQKVSDDKVKKKPIKLVLVLAGLSLRTAEMRSFIKSIAKQVFNLPHGEVVWVNPSSPYKSMIPFLNKVIGSTADDFALQCQTSL